jgi:hypothetical protein
MLPNWDFPRSLPGAIEGQSALQKTTVFSRGFFSRVDQM